MMTNSGERFICGAGHARAFWRAPAGQVDRVIWFSWLKGLAAVLGSVIAIALLMTVGSTRRPLEATALMEQLAVKLEHARTIHPDTTRTIAGLIA